MTEKGKKLNMFNIYALGVGGAIGSGIFVMMGFGIAYTGRSICLAVAIGCLYMLLAFLYHPIMASMFVLPGGEYDMKSMLFGPKMTGISGIFSFINNFGMAAYALAITEYIASVFPAIIPYSKLIAAAIVILAFGSTIKGSKFIATMTSVMTVILLVSIGLFIIVGLPKVQPGFFSAEGFFYNGGGGFFMAIAIMSFACMGTTMAPVSMMVVTEKPRRTIPIAIMFIVLTVAAIYALMGIVAAGVLPIEQVAGKPLGDVAAAIFPHWLYVVFILGGAVFAIATSMFGGVAMIRYPCMQIAEDGWIPAVFKKKTKDGYPYVTQGFFFLLTLIPIFLESGIDAIISLIMIPSMLMNAYLNVSLIRLVKKYPEHWKESVLHMPNPIFYTLCILSGVCALLVALSLFADLEVTEMIICVCLVLGCAAFAVYRLKTGAVKETQLKEKRDAIVANALSYTSSDK